MPLNALATQRPASRLRPPFTGGLLLITGLALLGRIAYVWIAKRDDLNVMAEGDAAFYSSVAHNLGDGNFFRNPFLGDPAADHPPLTVLVLGPTAFLFHDSVLAQRMTMAVIGALAVFVIGLLGRRVAGDRVGLLAAGAAAVYPNLWVNDGLVMSESISALTIAALLLAGVGLAQAPSWRRALVAGALCGLAVLARAEVGLLLPFMIWPILALAREVPWKERLARMAAASAATVLVISPWTLYNLTQYDEPVLVSLNDGTALRGSYCDAVYPDGPITGGWSLGCVLATTNGEIDRSVNAANQRREGLRYARTHLAQLPEVVAVRLGRTFGWYRPAEAVFINTGEGRDKAISWWCWWTFWAALPLAAYGAFVLHRRRANLWPFAATLVTTVAVTAAFYGIPRFRLPLEVAIVVLVGVAIDAMIRHLRNEQAPEPPDSTHPDTEPDRARQTVST